MKIITKIQSFSDIITNSSSEVFLMTTDNAMDFLNRPGEISLNYTITSLDSINRWDLDLYSGVCQLPDFETWGCTKEQWEQYLEDNKEELSKLIGYSVIDIEDHYADWEDDSDDARDLCVGYESRH